MILSSKLKNILFQRWKQKWSRAYLIFQNYREENILLWREERFWISLAKTLKVLWLGTNFVLKHWDFCAVSNGIANLLWTSKEFRFMTQKPPRGEVWSDWSFANFFLNFIFSVFWTLLYSGVLHSAIESDWSKVVCGYEFKFCN